jgi:hypothetical protein
METSVLSQLVAEMDELVRNYNESIRKRMSLQDQVDVLSDEAQRLGNVEGYLEEVLSDLKETRKERDTLRVLLRKIGNPEENKKDTRKVYVWDKGNGKHKGIAIAIAFSKKEAYNTIKDKVQDAVGLPMFWYFMRTKCAKVFKLDDFGLLLSWEEPKG